MLRVYVYFLVIEAIMAAEGWREKVFTKEAVDDQK